MTRRMNIGEAATAAGVTPKMARHYEQIGLLPAAVRTEAGYRQYDEADVAMLRFIRHSRMLGFSMEQIGQLMGLWRDEHRTSREVKALAERHLAVIDEKLAELQALRQQLQQLVQSCAGDGTPHCAIIDGLADGEPVAPRPVPVAAQPADHHPEPDKPPARHDTRPARPARETAATATAQALSAWMQTARQEA